MSEQSAFNRRQIKETAIGPQPGLLEQMNLPPGLIAFLRNNQRLIWIIVAIIAVLVTTVSLYASYHKYREKKAASALTLAMQAEEGERLNMLRGVVEEYSSTSSALWADVEIAHLAAAGNRPDEAVQILSRIRQDLSARNPLTPLIVFDLATLYEKTGNLDQARDAFQELSTFEGFSATAYANLGRIAELQDNKEQAVAMYRKYLELTDQETALQPGGLPGREIIESRVKLLQD
jgi:Flp pilus assembly protein TadD